MNIIFRVDASAHIGSGHVMRCLTLAESLRKKGAEVQFICRKHNGNLNELISNRGFSVKELKQPSKNLNSKKINLNTMDDQKTWLGVSEDQDAQDTINAIGSKKTDWLIVDHYALGEKWEKQLRSYANNIMVIDDLANRKHDCDILLDQNWYEKLESRYDGLVSATCTKLLGPQYALLRPEFSEVRKTLKPNTEKVNRIVVFFGGSDSNNMTGKTLKALSQPELLHLEADIVIGASNPHYDELKTLVKKRPNTYLHVQIDDISSIMVKADLAIGGGGVNTWERMCLGIESHVIITADNQVEVINDLNKNNYLKLIGNFRAINSFDIYFHLKKHILNKTSNPRSDNSMYLCDGYGVTRVLENISTVSVFDDQIAEKI